MNDDTKMARGGQDDNIKYKTVKVSERSSDAAADLSEKQITLTVHSMKRRPELLPTSTKARLTRSESVKIAPYLDVAWAEENIKMVVLHFDELHSSTFANNEYKVFELSIDEAFKKVESAPEKSLLFSYKDAKEFEDFELQDLKALGLDHDGSLYEGYSIMLLRKHAIVLALYGSWAPAKKMTHTPFKSVPFRAIVTKRSVYFLLNKHEDNLAYIDQIRQKMEKQYSIFLEKKNTEGFPFYLVAIESTVQTASEMQKDLIQRLEEKVLIYENLASTEKKDPSILNAFAALGITFHKTRDYKSAEEGACESSKNQLNEDSLELSYRRLYRLQQRVIHLKGQIKRNWEVIEKAHDKIDKRTKETKKGKNGKEGELKEVLAALTLALKGSIPSAAPTGNESSQGPEVELTPNAKEDLWTPDGKLRKKFLGNIRNEYKNLISQTEGLEKSLEEVEEFIKLNHSNINNKLLLLNTSLQLTAVCIAFGSYFCGIFGLPTENAIQTVGMYTGGIQNDFGGWIIICVLTFLMVSVGTFFAYVVHQNLQIMIVKS
jgi:hypothetical protein